MNAEREFLELLREFSGVIEDLAIRQQAHTACICALLNSIDQSSRQRAHEILRSLGEADGLPPRTAEALRLATALADGAIRDGGKTPDARSILKLIRGGKQ